MRRMTLINGDLHQSAGVAIPESLTFRNGGKRSGIIDPILVNKKWFSSGHAASVDTNQKKKKPNA